MPQQPVETLVDAAGPLLAVNHEHTTWAENQMVNICRRGGHGQVVEDDVAVAGEPVQ
jgi:hypothetical protein